MSKKPSKPYETYDLTSRWNVVEIDLLEQEVGGKFGKRRIVSARPFRRERAEKLRVSCEESQRSSNEILGCKSKRRFVLEEVKQ
jgi:hypothetical protein